jgi:dolichyl-phosphate-mannose--protein O-mannosyl transferase
MDSPLVLWLAVAVNALAAAWCLWQGVRWRRERQRLRAISEGYTSFLAARGYALWDEEG